MAKKDTTTSTVAKPKNAQKVSVPSVSRRMVKAVAREAREVGPLHDNTAFKSLMVRLGNGQREAAKKAKEAARVAGKTGGKGAKVAADAEA